MAFSNAHISSKWNQNSKIARWISELFSFSVGRIGDSWGGKRMGIGEFGGVRLYVTIWDTNR